MWHIMYDDTAPVPLEKMVSVQVMWHSMYGDVTYYVWWCDREDGVSAGVVWWCDIVCMLMWHNMYGDGVSAGVCTLQNAFSYCRMCSLKMVSVQVSVSHHHTSYVTSSYMLCHIIMHRISEDGVSASVLCLCHIIIHTMSHHHTLYYLMVSAQVSDDQLVRRAVGRCLCLCVSTQTLNPKP